MNLSILGSTGSIGTQALQVADELGDIQISAISGNSNLSLLEEQVRKYRPKLVCVADEKLAKEFKIAIADTSVSVTAGTDGMREVATINCADMVLSSVVGFAGLIPTYAAICEGKDIALANKETLVTAGSVIMQKVKENNVRLLPVDSEHSAIFQCLQGHEYKNIEKLLLTASGGPFFGMTNDELSDITPAQALKHPNWNMGAKISIDSATLMNKGLEIIEAKWLFDVSIDNIEVVVHRESIIHSMVQYVDGSIIAQMSPPDMKHPIQYAFTYPKREHSNTKRLNLFDVQRLTFHKADEDTFRCLKLAKTAGKSGGIMPTVLNSANEVAVDKFLKGEIKFLDIADIIENTMNEYNNIENPSIEEMVMIDKEIREMLG